MVPQTLGSDAKLIIKYTDKLSGVNARHTHSLSGTEWKAGTRVAYFRQHLRHKGCAGSGFQLLNACCLPSRQRRATQK